MMGAESRIVSCKSRFQTIIHHFFSFIYDLEVAEGVAESGWDDIDCDNANANVKRFVCRKSCIAQDDSLDADDSNVKAVLTTMIILVISLLVVVLYGLRSSFIEYDSLHREAEELPERENETICFCLSDKFFTQAWGSTNKSASLEVSQVHTL